MVTVQLIHLGVQSVKAGEAVSGDGKAGRLSRRLPNAILIIPPIDSTDNLHQLLKGTASCSHPERKEDDLPEVYPICNETELEGDLGIEEGNIGGNTFFVAVIETSPPLNVSSKTVILPSSAMS